MIAFNYKEAMSQAQELKQISEEMESLVKKTLNAQQSELSYAWRGDSAELFLQKAEKLCGEISRTAKLTVGIANAVQTAAKAVKTAEEAAEQAIKTVGV